MSPGPTCGRGGPSRRGVLRTALLALGASWLGAHRGALAGPAGPDVATAARFPLGAAPGRHHLVDAMGRPFLIHGDTAWSLIVELTREEVELYLADRRSRGFNALLVSLIEHEFATHAPANAYGEPPFAVSGDFAAPNDRYFDHAHWVVRRAAAQGLLVLLAPAYVGYGGGSQGWYQEMLASGPGPLRRYGQYVGRRFRDCRNVLWVHGGDDNPPRKDLVRAVAEGIRAVDPGALHTAHGSRGTAALDYWGGEPWLTVNTIYTALPGSWFGTTVLAAAAGQRARPEGLPFLLIEGAYENEHGADERFLRAQAYQALLSGAAGHIFGNNPVWHFSAPGLYPAPASWRASLDSPGARSMTRLRELLMAIPWWRLRPDSEGGLLTGGLGRWSARAVAACADDRSCAIVYLPSARPVEVDLARLAGPNVAAHWFDPAGGQYSAAAGSPFSARGRVRLSPVPARNSGGLDDWVLVLRSSAP
jgi:hypothetical protein